MHNVTIYIYLLNKKPLKPSEMQKTVNISFSNCPPMGHVPHVGYHSPSLFSPTPFFRLQIWIFAISWNPNFEESFNRTSELIWCWGLWKETFHMWTSLPPQLLVPTTSRNITHFRCGQESLNWVELHFSNLITTWMALHTCNVVLYPTPHIATFLVFCMMMGSLLIFKEWQWPMKPEKLTVKPVVVTQLFTNISPILGRWWEVHR